MYLFGQKQYIADPFFPTSQTIIQVGLFTIVVPTVCVSVANVLNYFGISFLCQSGSFIYVL